MTVAYESKTSNRLKFIAEACLWTNASKFESENHSGESGATIPHKPINVWEQWNAKLTVLLVIIWAQENAPAWQD